MGDDITIGVTEIVNNIEVTAQPNDQIVDISVIDNADDVTLNITPTVIEININKGSSYAKWGTILGTLSDQTDLQNALDLKANLVGGKVPASELPSYVDDIIEVANYAALPATGETGKIYVTLDNNKIYRWSGSIYIEIAANNAIWGAITGTLSNQTDLQNALNAKFDDPTGDITQYIAGDGSLITFPVAGQSGTLVREVRNTTGATLLKGTVVYINGATGNKPTIAKALATGDSTSAQTFGLLQADMPNNTNGYVVCVGDIIGLDTSAITEGTQLYLSSTTAGAYTTTKQLAPAHLVYVGVVTRSHASLGQIEVKIQNGYELDEIHDVAISSKANNQFLVYESATDLWKNKSISTILGYTPANDANVVHLTGNESIGGIKTFTGSSVVLDNSSGTTISTFKGASTTVAEFVFNSSFTQFRSIASGGYLFKNSASANSLSITDSGNATFLGSVTASSIIKNGGTSSQFLKADGSVDSTSYQPLLTNPISGSGTTNYIPKFTGASAIGNSLIYDNGTNVGIGTTSPLTGGGAAKWLTLEGSTYSGGIIGSVSGVAKFYNYFDNASNTAALQGASGVGVTLWSDSTERMRITSGGNVGIGTASPAQKLDVNGDIGTGGVGLNGSLKLKRSSDGAVINEISYVSATDELRLNNGSGSGNITFLTTSAERMRITSGGNVGIGTSSPAYKLEVAGTGGFVSSVSIDASSTPFLYFRSTRASGQSGYIKDDGNLVFQKTESGGGFRFLNSSSTILMAIDSIGNVDIDTLGTGLVYSNSGTLTSTNPSDSRLKDNIVSLNYGLNEILKLRPVSYNWKNDNINQGKQFGFIAQEVQEVMPELVKEFETEDGERLGLDKEGIYAALVNAIQEQQKQIEELKTLINK